MCLIAWNWQPKSSQPLLLIANRDEFYARPSMPLHWWHGNAVLAGKDLQAGGTWLGMSRTGRLAALTNYRDPQQFRADAASRGKVVSDFLQSKVSVADYLAELRVQAANYNPFNLLLLDGQTLMGFESQGLRSFAIKPGIGAVSNAQFDTPWPKVVQLKQGLTSFLNQDHNKMDGLFDLLNNDTTAHDSELPHTGIPIERERGLSAAFIRMPDYGTRSSTVVRKTMNGWEAQERSYDATGAIGEATFSY